MQNFEPECVAQVLELLLRIRDAVLWDHLLVRVKIVAWSQVSLEIRERVLGELAVNQVLLLCIPVNAVETALIIDGVLQGDPLIVLYLIE